MLACLATLTGSLTKAAVIAPVSILHTGSAGEEGAFSNEANLINGSGLSGSLTSESDLTTVTHAVVSGSNAWATVSSVDGNLSDWFANASNGTVIFEMDLGGSYQLNQFATWGYHFGSELNGNFMSSILLEFSTNGGSSYTSSQSISISAPSPNFTHASISSLSSVTANYVRMTATDNFFGIASTPGDRVGISELRFTGTAIPEPATHVPLLLTPVLLALYRRRTDHS